MILRQLVSEKIPPSRATPKSQRRAWVGGLIVGLLAAAVLMRTEPLGVTSELSRVARFLGNYFALLPERMEGLDAIRGCASRPGKVCSREDSFLYAPSSLVRWGLHSWRASLNSNGLRPRGLFWHSWEAYFWVGEQWSPLAVRSARCFRGFTPHRFRAAVEENLPESGFDWSFRPVSRIRRSPPLHGPNKKTERCQLKQQRAAKTEFAGQPDKRFRADKPKIERIPRQGTRKKSQNAADQRKKAHPRTFAESVEVRTAFLPSYRSSSKLFGGQFFLQTAPPISLILLGGHRCRADCVLRPGKT
jgi:hypothetical protein